MSISRYTRSILPLSTGLPHYIRRAFYVALGCFALMVAPSAAQGQAEEADDPDADETSLFVAGGKPIVTITPTTRHDTPTKDEVELARHGKALPIIIHLNASADIKAAAADAARILSAITNARFSVQTGDGSAGLVIGTIADFPQPEPLKGLQIERGFEGREAFVIRPANNRLLVLGATSLGATNGIYRLLHELGCRWFAPTPTWEVLPQPQAVLTWNRSITDRPQILSRSIFYKTQFDFEADRTPYGTTPKADRDLWGRRNLHLDGLGVKTGHSYGSIRRRFAKEFAANPAYWPLIQGKRAVDPKRPDHTQLELSNPAVRKLVVEYARSFFAANPDAQMVSVDPNDGGAWSESAEFRALGSVSDAVFGMANEVARMLHREFPGKQVGLYSYREHADPPSFPLEPNVHVQLSSMVISKHSPQELIDLWCRRHNNLGFYEYYAPYAWHLDRLPGANASSLTYLTKRIRAQTAGPVASISAEASGSWALFAMGYYVAARLMWNSSLDVAELRTDFLEKAYGPAAPAMDRYYARWSPDSRPLVTHELVSAMCRDLREAENLARRQPAVVARLRDLQQYIRYLELYSRVRATTSAQPYAEREAAFIALMRHSYRTRYTYMTHWGLASQRLFQTQAEYTGVVKVTPGPPRTKTLLNEHLRPSKQFPENPWRDTARFTLAEIARDFAASEAYFSAPPVEITPFSTDLVRVRWPAPVPSGGLAAAKPVPMWVKGGTLRLLVRSVRGEAVRFRLIPYAVERYLSRTRQWRLTDAAGKTVDSGDVRFSSISAAIPVQVPVPRAGTYELVILDVANGGLTVEPDTAMPAVVKLVPGEALSHRMFKQGWFFYVPKGTKELIFYAEPVNGAVAITGPDNKELFRSAERAERFIHLPVPAAAAGRVWRVNASHIGRFCLLNVPPLLAPSPSRLLVPREVATRDGL